tara:strand:- start:2931 stop:3209 length:279 start_codon:yes stop_codon:yes gene_type:complete
MLFFLVILHKYDIKYDMSIENNNKFKKLANARVNKAIKLIKLIGNLSNKSHYSYSKKQSKQIIDALQQEINYIKNKFNNPAGGREVKDFEID